MKKGAKLGLIFGVGALVAAASYYFLVYRPAHPKYDKKDDETEPKTDAQILADFLSGNGNSSSGNGTTPTYTVIGKKAYANKDGVKVVYVADGTVVRTKNKNELVGVIDGKKTLGGNPFYTLNGGAWAVSINLVTLQ